MRSGQVTIGMPSVHQLDSPRSFPDRMAFTMDPTFGMPAKVLQTDVLRAQHGGHVEQSILQ